MKVLIAEDDPVSRRLLEVFLKKWGYDVLVTADGAQAWDVLQGPEKPSLVISDWMMPVMDGVDLCKKIRDMENSGYIYFIILTAKGKMEDIIKGLESGADDYLVKPFDQEELKCRVKIGERIIRLEKRIMQLACVDPLTGALNRRAFMERMEEEVDRSCRGNHPFSIILTDIDHFKRVNDTYGHQAGDAVLQHFTERLSSSRAYDFVGRYGGEEFIKCLPNTDGLQSGAIAERIRQDVERMVITLPAIGQTVRITASFGIATLDPERKENADSIIKRADDGLYRAKNEGRNRVCTI